MLVQQTTRYLHRSKANKVLLKFDIARAFDVVSWPFLLDVMRHLGFGRRWCEWIYILLATASTRILLNGVPGCHIYHAKGLRQGDPVSPMLFTLVIDALNSLMLHAMLTGLLRRLSPNLATPSVSLYADDVAIFCHPSMDQLLAVRAILQVFGHATGLHTNFASALQPPSTVPTPRPQMCRPFYPAL